MPSQTVKSAAGNTVEIVDDADWVQLTGGTLRGLYQWTGSKPPVIRYLWEHGKVRESSGRATAVIHEGLAQYGPLNFRPTAITMMTSDVNNAPAFARDINGKRCYSIDLVALPRTWYDKLRVDLRESHASMNGQAREVFEAIPVEESNGNGHAEIEVVTPTGEIATETISDTIEVPDYGTVSAPAIDLEIASQVAMSLLTTVVEIISAGSSATVDQKVRQLQNDLADVMGKLSARLEDNERLRRQVRELGEEIKAIRYERDGLRQRLRNTESNLTAALRGDSLAAVNSVIQKRVDSIMRTTPTPKGRDDD